jgi:N-acetylmuramoyl-L-alanine amidase
VGYVVEKEVTLDVALKTRALLESAGVNVVMTRTGDTALQRNGSLEENRRDLQARSSRASTEKNLFVSIHVNSSVGSAAQGVETYVFGEPIDAETLRQAERENGGGAVGRAVTNEARRFARSLISDQLASENLKFSRRLAGLVQSHLLSETGAVNRGVKSNVLYVLRTSRIPAVLVEVGFAKHPVEGRSLSTSAYRQKVARGIANGVLQFLYLL